MTSEGSRIEGENLCESNSRMWVLVLHNDDVNTFDHVIESLCKICNHNTEQAGQCALIAHTKGRYEIKKGHKEELLVMESKLKELSLTITIE